jgi:diguanylate cyclase (GGDEF)-like protein/PAS domain S-box-containing protein
MGSLIRLAPSPWRQPVPAPRADRVRLIVARVEPLLVLGFGSFLLTRLAAWHRPVTLVAFAAVLFVAGGAGLAYANAKPVVEVRIWLGLLSIVAIGLINREYVLDLLAWFAIFGLAAPLLLGLRRGSPVIAVATVAMLVGGWHVFNFYAGFIRGMAVVLGGVLFGLIADSFEESDAIATRARREAQRAEKREQQLRTVLDAAPIGIMIVGDSPANSFMNLEVADAMAADLDSTDRSAVKRFLHPDDGWVVDEMIATMLAGRSCEHVCRLMHPTQGERLVRVIGAPSLDAQGRFVASVIIAQDIDDDVRQRRAIERFRAVADATSDLVCIESTRGEPRYLNAAAASFWSGLTDLPGEATFELVPAEYRRALRVDAAAAIADRRPWTGELELFDHHGDRYPFSAVIVGIRDDNDELIGWATTYRALTERKQLERRLAFQAGHDTLTGLPNRQQLFDFLTAELGTNGSVTLMFCDLDDFKIINDSLGHSVGDTVLRMVARRFSSAARADEFVGRLGGDEFLVVCRNVADSHESRIIAQRFIDAVRQPINVDGREHVITVSVGIASSTAEHNDASALMQEADLAMYSAKRVGRGQVALFDQHLRTRADRRLEFERELREAFRLNQLELRFEPVVRVADTSVLGFEALVRWKHPERGLVSPGEFLPVVSEMGLDSALGDFVLQAATEAVATLRLVAPHVTMSVNVSAAQLQHDRFVDDVARAVASAGIVASALTIEITEQIVMADVVAARPKLEELRSLGVRLAIDDFGTGYSNLAMLRKFSADYVKIDRSLIDGLGTEPGDTQMVRLILLLTQELGFIPVAEGVETQAQLDELARLECRLAQGWFFTTSLTIADAVRFLRASQPAATTDSHH